MLTLDPRTITLGEAVLAANIGWPGSLDQAHIPRGWASIAYLNSDVEYVGPVREENTDYIVIDVLGQDFTFPRDRVLVTYPL